MSPTDLVFLALLVASGVYAFAYGGWEGRTLCALLTSAAFGTRFVIHWLGPKLGLPGATFLADCALLAGLAAVAFLSRRYWPLWIAAFHLMSVMTFVAWKLLPNIDPRVFEETASFWSLLIQLVLPIGVYLDRKAGLMGEQRDDTRSRGPACATDRPEGFGGRSGRRDRHD